jgi:tRNA-2-methylthio-N6-dimethylallyladenosine synthase
MINQLQHSNNPIVDVSFPEIEKFDRLPEPKAEGASAFVSIMRGVVSIVLFALYPTPVVKR